MARVNSRQHSGTISDTLTSFVSDIDLVTSRPNFSQSEGGDRAKVYPRQILCPVAGDLALRFTLGGSTYDDTITVTAGTTLNLEPSHILSSGTTVTKVTVIW